MTVNGKRDSQRSAVYSWEFNLAKMFPILAVPVTLEDIEKIARHIYDDFGLDPETVPAVKDGRGSRRAWYAPASGDYPFGFMRFPRRSRSLGPALHEIGHALQDRSRIWPDGGDKYRAPWHGRGFASLYLVLLYRYLDVNISAARSAGQGLAPRRVWFAPMDSIPKPSRPRSLTKGGGFQI